METEIRQEILKQISTGDNRFSSLYLPAKVAEKIKCTQTQVWENLWHLVSDELIYLEPGTSGIDHWRWRLSKYGKDAVTGKSWEPKDPEGFLTRLKREIPEIDELVEMYLSQALKAYSARCYLASSVMLGVAAEQSFRIMATAFAGSSFQGSEQMEKLLENKRKNYYEQWEEFRKRIDSQRKTLPNDMADKLTLDAIADLIRLTRNEAGHPSGKEIDEDTARLHLIMATTYLKRMDLLTQHFIKNKKSSD
jgi:hypothetical protein